MLSQLVPELFVCASRKPSKLPDEWFAWQASGRMCALLRFATLVMTFVTDRMFTALRRDGGADQ
jgi:hypothetical protein